MFTIAESAPAVLETTCLAREEGFHPMETHPAVDHGAARAPQLCTHPTAGVHAVAFVISSAVCLNARLLSTLALRPTIHLTSPSGTVGAFSVLNVLSRIRCSYVVYYYRNAYLPMYVKMRAARVLPCLDSCLPPAQCYRWSRCCCILFFSSSKSFWC